METSNKKPKNVTSLRKKKANVPQIPGTKVSFQNAQLLTSTGVPSLDAVLGGGLAVGTAILIEEDCFRTYSNLLMKYFLAEGVHNKHAIFLASGDLAPEKILQEIPAAVVVDQKIHQNPTSEDKLKIAWRYQKQTASTEASQSASQHYDLFKTVDKETLDKCQIKKWSPAKSVDTTSSSFSFVEEPYGDLLQEIRNQIYTEDFHTAITSSQRNILRIAICSMDSPMWRSDECGNEFTVLRFLYGLRALLRSSFSVAMVTVPQTLCQDAKWFSRVKQMVDSAICLESLTSASKNDNLMLKDFDGLLHILKLPVLNSCAYNIYTADLAFKLKRKNFIVEKLHLPPDLSGPEAKGDSSSVSCGSGQKTNLLDF